MTTRRAKPVAPTYTEQLEAASEALVAAGQAAAGLYGKLAIQPYSDTQVDSSWAVYVKHRGAYIQIVEMRAEATDDPRSFTVHVEQHLRIHATRCWINTSAASHDGQPVLHCDTRRDDKFVINDAIVDLLADAFDPT